MNSGSQSSHKKTQKQPLSDFKENKAELVQFVNEDDDYMVRCSLKIAGYFYEYISVFCFTEEIKTGIIIFRTKNLRINIPKVIFSKKNLSRETFLAEWISYLPQKPKLKGNIDKGNMNLSQLYEELNLNFTEQKQLLFEVDALLYLNNPIVLLNNRNFISIEHKKSVMLKRQF